MQIIETNRDGLKRTLKVSVEAGELGDRFNARLDELRTTIHIKGFRKGKVPLAHIRKLYGRSIMAEVLQDTIEETSKKAIAERDERPAVSPAVALPEDKEEMERVISGKADLTYSLSFEVLPQVPLPEPGRITVERLTADVEDSGVSKILGHLAERSTSYEPQDGRAAQEGDRVVLDFEGTIEGAPFEGSTQTDVAFILGRDRFLPGFTEGLAGVMAGERRTVPASFPEDYPAPVLAGKTALFDVTVKSVAPPAVPALDDAFAQSLGAESLEKLREQVRQSVAAEYAAASRAKMKLDLLDALDAAYSFELPPSLVAEETQEMWDRYVRELEKEGKKPGAGDGNEEKIQADFRRLAERRVRLGLILGAFGEQNRIEVSADELREALVQEVRRYPGYENKVYEYYRKTPGALAKLKAPVYEEKVIDLLLGKVKITERKVSAEELLRLTAPAVGVENLPGAEPDAVCGHDHDHGHEHRHDQHRHDHGQEHGHEHDHERHARGEPAEPSAPAAGGDPGSVGKNEQS